MKREYYNSIFILDIESLSDEKLNDLVMCGSSNWDNYFTINDVDSNIETLSNVNSLEFENSLEFNRYIKTNSIIDYSIEHTNPLVLAYG